MPSRPSVFVVGSQSPERDEFARVLARLAGAAEAVPFQDGPVPSENGIVTVDAAVAAERGTRLRLLADGLVVEVRAGEGGASHEAHMSVEPARGEVERLAARVLEMADARPIVVPLGDRTYRVEIAIDAVDRALGSALRELDPTAVVLVSDDVVAPLVLPKLEGALAAAPKLVPVTIPTGEKHKTLATVEEILRAAVEAPVDRRAVVVGVGGGVVTDIAGLAAALALRGLRWVAVPTTLLGMVDASVGGKTAVDLGSAKNAVGAFHQPSRVIVDPTLTRTETVRAFRSGLAEVVKTALIGDASLFAMLREPGGVERLERRRERDAVASAVRAAIAVKAGVVGRDERESGERAHLNLGHTIGHALEAEGGFERLTHGEAVSLGLVAAMRVGVRLGITPPELARETVELLGALGLPTALDAEPLESAMRWVGFDKKRSGAHVKFVVVRRPGRAEVVLLGAAELRQLVLP